MSTDIILDGVWRGIIDAPFGAREVELRLQVGARSLSGVLVDDGNELELTGDRDGRSVEMVTTSALLGRSPLRLTGYVEGDSLSGELDLDGQSVGTWSVHRMPSAEAGPSA